MTLWHIIRFNTIRHLWLTTISYPWPRPERDEWVAVKQRNAVAWSPNELHRFLKGEDDVVAT